MTAVTQASLEYGGTAVRNMVRLASQAAQDHWYFVAGGIVLLVLFWTYLRK